MVVLAFLGIDVEDSFLDAAVATLVFMIGTLIGLDEILFLEFPLGGWMTSLRTELAAGGGP